MTETRKYENITNNDTISKNISNNTNLNNTKLLNETNNKTIIDDKKNNINATINMNNTDNKTIVNKTKARKKKEWKSMQFKHQINEKGNNNLYFFISILFRQPRLEYALHNLAYEDKNEIKNLTEKIWIPHLIYKLFNDKKKEENITKIKIDKIRYTFSKFSDDHFRTNFISRYLVDTNLTVIEDFLKKYNSFIIKEHDNNFFNRIPFALIMYTLVFILGINKLMKIINDTEDKEEEKKKEIKEEIIEELKKENEIKEDNIEQIKKD